MFSGKLSGMNENSGKVDLLPGYDATKLGTHVLAVANVLLISADNNIYRFASKTVSSGADTLVSVRLVDNRAYLTVNCEKMVIGSMLLKDIKRSLSGEWHVQIVIICVSEF